MYGSKCHLTRIANHTVQAHPQTPFGIHPDHQGNIRIVLVDVGKFSLVTGIALEKNQSSDMMFPDESHDFLGMLGVFIGIGRNHKQLADLFAKRHLIHDAIHPEGFNGQ